MRTRSRLPRWRACSCGGERGTVGGCEGRRGGGAVSGGQRWLRAAPGRGLREGPRRTHQPHADNTFPPTRPHYPKPSPRKPRAKEDTSSHFRKKHIIYRHFYQKQAPWHPRPRAAGCPCRSRGGAPTARARAAWPAAGPATTSRCLAGTRRSPGVVGRKVVRQGGWRSAGPPGVLRRALEVNIISPCYASDDTAWAQVTAGTQLLLIHSCSRSADAGAWGPLLASVEPGLTSRVISPKVCPASIRFCSWRRGGGAKGPPQGGGQQERFSRLRSSLLTLQAARRMAENRAPHTCHALRWVTPGWGRGACAPSARAPAARPARCAAPVRAAGSAVDPRALPNSRRHALTPPPRAAGGRARLPWQRQRW